VWKYFKKLRGLCVLCGKKMFLQQSLLWYIDGALCALSALSYYALHLRLGKRERFIPKPAAADWLAESTR
jgi:hypothetical protein